MNIKLVLAALLALSALTAQAQNDNRKTHNIGVGINRHAADSTLYSSGRRAGGGGGGARRGAQIGTFSATVRRLMRGVNIAGIVIAVGSDMRGVQIAGVSNLLQSGNGFQVALFNNVAGENYSGIQLSALSNISLGMKRGMQIGGTNICSSYMRGVQTGFYNYADTQRFADRTCQRVHKASARRTDWCDKL